MHKQSMKKGFTLVELTFSIAFIAVLSLVVMVLIANSLSEYHRGLTLNQINSAGMEVVDDMRTTIQNAPASSITALCSVLSDSFKGICEGNNGQNLVSVKYSQSKIKLGDKELYNVPMFGAFCTGNYSYIWNSGYFFNDDVDKSSISAHPATLRYTGADGDHYVDKNQSGKPFRLLKVKDENRTVCLTSNPRGEYDIQVERDSKPEFTVISEEPFDLLEGSYNLALYDLYAPVPAADLGGNSLYYSVSFVLGTLQGGANVTASGDYCVAPEELRDDQNHEIENFDYCAINKFNFAAEAIGGGE